MADFYALKICQVRSLTPDSVAITLEIPKEHAQRFAFTAGQYITIRKELKVKELRRAYSISSSPTKNNITIGIKKVDTGGFSAYANHKLAEGDYLEVMPPEGRFTFKPGVQPKKIMAFAAGSGITPIMSIARTVLDSHPENQMVLLYGNKSYADTMFYTELVKLQLDHPERFSLYFTLSQSREEDSLFGRIDNARINYILKNKHQGDAFDDYYLCGPEAMIDLVMDNLSEAGIPEEKIHYELFTSTEISDELPVKPDGTCQLKVVIDDEEFTIEMDKKHKVLDAVLKENIDAPYSCQGGVCSTCIAKVTEGSAEMAKNQILTDSEIQEGYILTCQAHPTSAVLKIDYDDV